MSADLFRVISGIDIQSEDLASNANVLQGSNVPGGRVAEQNAPIGSIYLRTDAESNGHQVYWKFQDVNNDSTDWRQGVSKSYVDSVAQNLSWKQPVVVKDDTTYADLTAAETALNTGTVDGVTLVEGDRVLLTGVTGSDEAIYVVTGTPGAGATYVLDGITEDGDSVLVLQGTFADSQWAYDATTTEWVQFGGASSQAELSHLRAFIGKTAPGAESPTYSSTDVVTPSANLETAIGELDAAIGTRAYTENNLVIDNEDITSSIDKLDVAIGTGNLSNIGGNWSISANMTWGTGSLDLTEVLDQLNNAIGDRTYVSQFSLTNGESVADSLDALDVVIGDITNSSAWTAAGFLTPTTLAANSVQDTLDAINVKVGEFDDLTAEGTGTATSAVTTVLDSTLSATDATEVKWIIQVKNGTSRQAMEVHAITDGTLVDYTTYAVVKLGSSVGTLGMNITLNAGNWNVSLTPANTLTYTIKRVSYSNLA